MTKDKQGRMILYNDNRGIEIIEEDPVNEEYYLILGQGSRAMNYLIPRGVLSEITRPEYKLRREDVLQRLQNVTGNIMRDMEELGIDYNDVLIALHRAKIASLETEVEHWVGEARDLK